MKIKKLSEALVINCPFGGFISSRMILADDGMGFSMSSTVIPVGKEQFWHYKNHLEACYCISGKGVLRNIETDEHHLIEQGTMYVLDKNDAHTFEAIEEVTLICVFNPPLKGNEVHGKDGSYE